MANKGGHEWGLEVVRGREIGRVFALAPGHNVLGNALNGEQGIDLSDQENASPRRMAARQARLDRAAETLSLSDLDSPGGTFVNRQRLLPGQARRLEPGDVIQVGAVQLRVVGATAPMTSRPVPVAGPPPPKPPPAPTTVKTTVRPGSLATPFVTLNSGATCRTWDDFLTLSARNWTELREELQSGRLTAFLKTVGRDDLVPPSASAKSADERLDDWLGRLPTTRAAEPDLEVHPSVVRIRAPGGGGTVRSKIVITNTGYRLLRSSLRLEPPETSWIRMPPGFTSGTITIAETSEIAFDVEIPETLTDTRTAAFVIESNGGTRLVEVRVEPPAKPDLPPDAGAVDDRPAGMMLQDALASRGPGARIFLAYLALLGLRGLVVAGDMMAKVVNLDGGSSSPSLGGGAIVMAIVGGVAAVRLATRRDETGDVAPAAFAGAFAGVLAAAIAVATCRAVEPVLGGRSALEAVGLLALGTIAGLVSLRLVPYRSPEGEMP